MALDIKHDHKKQKNVEEALRESEANFRVFFETIDDLILVATHEGTILFANQALRRKLCYTQEELVTMNVLDLHVTTDRREANEIFASMLQGDRGNCPLPLIAKNGTVLPVETRVWFGKWDGMECIFGVSKDLSVEQEAKQRFERLFRSNPSPMVLSIISERRIIDINDAFLRVFGYSRTEVLDKTAAELALFVHPEQQDAAAVKLASTGRVTDLELQVRCKDGTICDGLFSGEVIENQGKRYLLTVMVDITANKRMTAALARERERLAWIIQGTHAGTWEWNVQTGATIFNDRWAEIVGYSLAELGCVSIKTWDNLTHPDDLLHNRELLKKHFCGELAYYECETRMRHKNGEWVWVLDRGKVATWSDDGKPVMMLGTHQEITSRKRVELELARLSSLQHQLMQLATNFVNVPSDRQDDAINQSLALMGRLIQADRAYLFTYDLEKGVTSNTHEWCNEGITPEIANLQNVPIDSITDWVAAHLQGEETHVPDVLKLPSDHNLRTILEPQGIRSLITLPLMQGSSCIGSVGFDAVREVRIWKKEEFALLRVLAELYSNFEARRDAERAMRGLQNHLAQARDKAQEAARAKTLFLANMSHEIRTPLNAILGYAQIIGRDCRTCELAQRIKGLTQSSEHLLALINDLLELARSDGQCITLTPSGFNFTQLLEDVRLIFARRLQTLPLQLEVCQTSEVPSLLHADPGKIRQVLMNLVSNAIKFTEKGGIRLWASVLEKSTPDSLLIAVDVEDTGCGIKEADKEVIFELFACLETSKTVKGGIGLGLPLSRRYARALGGDVTVESRVDVGSRFRFTFRASTCPADARPTSCGEVAHLSPDQDAYRILIVDDDASNREMLATLLKSVGFVVELAESAMQAVQRLHPSELPKIDMVLLDKCMPKVDGFEAVHLLRSLPDGARLKILIVTASGFSDQREEVCRIGADGFAAKPIQLSRLLEEIARVSGVRFDYEATTIREPTRPDSEVLSLLSTEHKDHLKRALRRGDKRSLHDLTAQIASVHPHVAERIQPYVEVYNYEGLRRLLDADNTGVKHE